MFNVIVSVRSQTFTVSTKHAFYIYHLQNKICIFVVSVCSQTFILSTKHVFYVYHLYNRIYLFAIFYTNGVPEELQYGALVLLTFYLKNNFMASFYGQGSTAQGFKASTKRQFPLNRQVPRSFWYPFDGPWEDERQVNLEATQSVVLIMGSLECSTLTTTPDHNSQPLETEDRFNFN